MRRCRRVRPPPPTLRQSLLQSPRRNESETEDSLKLLDDHGPLPLSSTLLTENLEFLESRIGVSLCRRSHDQRGVEICGCRPLSVALQRQAAGGQHSSHGDRHADGFLRSRGVRRPHGLRPRARSRAGRADSHCAGGDAGQGLPRRPHARGPPPRPCRPRGQQALALAARPRRHRRRGAARPHPRARRARVGDHRGAAPERDGERRGQAGQGRLLRHGPGAHPEAEARRESCPRGHHHRRVRAQHHEGGQRPRLRVPAAGRLLRRHRLWQPCRSCEDGDHAGRRLRRRIEFRRSCEPASMIDQALGHLVLQQPAAIMVKLHGIWHAAAASREQTVLLEEVEFASRGGELVCWREQEIRAPCSPSAAFISPVGY